MIHKTIIALAIITAILPHLGFPGSWTDIIITIFGLSIAILAFIIIRRHEYEV